MALISSLLLNKFCMVFSIFCIFSRKRLSDNTEKYACALNILL